MNRTFEKKYLFSGRLVLKTGLHIGGGQTIFSTSDSPVIRTPDGKPFIPGSSLKGAFRSTVEKLAPLAGVWSCGLSDMPVKVGETEKQCIGAQGKAQDDFNKARSEANWTDQQLLDRLESKLCDTCKLFGSPYTASKINFGDLYTDDDSDGVIQIRDGVAIDRDSERAVDNLLYNYEVVAPELAFQLRITLDDPTKVDLRLTCLGLSEFLSGFGYLGGKRSRGLGQCEIQDFAVYRLDLTGQDRAEKILKYLQGRTPDKKMDSVDNPQSFINAEINKLVEGQVHA